MKAKSSCVCGSTVINMNSHYKTKKHLKFVSADINPIVVSTNETFGMSVEKSICELFDIPNNISKTRTKSISIELQTKIRMELDRYGLNIATHLGYLNGATDFLTTTGQTISIKSNYNGFKVCPQNIGQITRLKFKKTFSLNPNWSDVKVKQWIINHPTILFKEYFKNLFCCDYILWVHNERVLIVKSSTIAYKRMKNSEFTFSQSAESWNESSSYRYNNLSIGEFQFHSNRDCIKFRFNLRNLLKMIII